MHRACTTCTTSCSTAPPRSCVTASASRAALPASDPCTWSKERRTHVCGCCKQEVGGGMATRDSATRFSSGSGTYVFAAAVARPIDSGLRLAQLFLPQPGMEAAFLHSLSDELAPASGVGSFNGGSFDLPILRTRWVMARMQGDLQHPPHVDLLTLVRSLYRHRMESCTLRM